MRNSIERGTAVSKKNIYLVQPSFMNESAVQFPYAIGALASYAWTFEDVREAYDLKDVLFLREKPEQVVDSLQSPYLIGFSCYIWNYEYNKALAKKVKERFPDCRILFGGPQIPESTQPLEENPFVDFLIHNEGEIPFRALLQTLAAGTDLHRVSNISFRDGGECVTTAFTVECTFDFPSPITSGFFDRLLREHPDLEFLPLVETNRGCPNHCAYCSWANNKARVRLVPLERVFGDLTWISEHHMEFVSCADANFGMFPRDEQIADKIVELYRRNGYPKKFQVSYTKDSDERVFRITEKLARVGICKGVTLSFQTMSHEAQKNIGRSNMDIDFYKRLSERYDEAGIPTYTELIIGLPGETFESFRDGVEELLESGRHNALLVHLCELLPLAEMHRESYMEKFGIGYAKIPLNQPHAPRQKPDDIAEYSKVVTSTYSMPQEMWKRTVLFATCVSCFHHLGLLQTVALYLYAEKGVLYSDFYLALLDHLLQDETGVFCAVRDRLDGIIRQDASAVFFDERFGDIAWSFEEYAFLRIVHDKDAFYAAVAPFLSRYFEDMTFCRELLSYQSFLVKTVRNAHAELRTHYRWKPYFDALLHNGKTALERRDVTYTIDDRQTCASWPEYARNVLWYGRRGGKNIYTSELGERIEDA